MKWQEELWAYGALFRVQGQLRVSVWIFCFCFVYVLFLFLFFVCNWVLWVMGLRHPLLTHIHTYTHTHTYKHTHTNTYTPARRLGGVITPLTMIWAKLAPNWTVVANATIYIDLSRIGSFRNSGGNATFYNEFVPMWHLWQRYGQ